MNDFFPNELATPPAWSLALGVIGRVLIYVSAGLFAVSAHAWFYRDRTKATQVIGRIGFAGACIALLVAHYDYGVPQVAMIYGFACLFGLSALAWLYSVRTKIAEPVGRIGFSSACYALLGAFIVLGVLFAAKRYEFEYVYGHTDSLNTLAYRIAGIWSGQEGSFLLWAACSSIFALLTVRRAGSYRRWYTVAFAFFLGGIASILAFESPFNLNMFEGVVFVPEEGVGLSPALQNYWVIIHPPTIFLGFGSLTSLFALAFAALVTQDYERWIPIVRPWAIVSATLVGVGLCMGGFWAYETLGWGGFWMWDPVENVSFVPWCFTIALIHGVIVQATKKKWKMTNLLFGALPFLAFLYGTFLTRSGALSETSVHSFAEMDRAALKMLLVLLIGSLAGFGGLWSYRTIQERKRVASEDSGPVLKREGFYLLGNASLLALGVTAMIGMSVPFIMALQGKQPAVVEEWLYHQVLPWLFIPLMLLMAVTPFVSWKGISGRELINKVYTVLCITIGSVGIFLFATVVTPFASKLEMNPTVMMFGTYEVTGMGWVVFLFGTCVFVLVGNGWRVVDLFKKSKLGTMPFLSHIGIAILMAGLIVSRGYEVKAQSFVMKDHPGTLLDYEVRYGGMTLENTDRDNELKLDFYELDGGNEPIFTATPGLYETQDGDHVDTMVWPHIQRGFLMDTYISLGVPQKSIGPDVTVKLGESVQVGGWVMTYNDMVRGGVMGAVGSSIGAQITFADGITEEEVQPSMSLDAEGHIVSDAAPLDENFELVLISLSAEDLSATLRVQRTSTLYPIEVYHKPMTILVWLGTAMMAIAGFATAFYRRSQVSTESDTSDDDPK